MSYGDFATDSSEGEEEEAEEEVLLRLPQLAPGQEYDLATIAALPVSLQLQLVAQLREAHNQHNRVQLQSASQLHSNARLPIAAAQLPQRCGRLTSLTHACPRIASAPVCHSFGTHLPLQVSTTSSPPPSLPGSVGPCRGSATTSSPIIASEEADRSGASAFL